MNESLIWIFLFGVLSVFPFFPLRHVPVMDRLKIPFPRLMLYATAIMAVQGLSFLWMAQNYAFGSPELAWHRKLFMIPYVLLTLAFSKDSKGKTLFMDFFMVGIVMSVIDLAYIINRTWFAEAFAQAPYRTDVLVRTAITILIYPPLYLLFKKSLRPIMQIEVVSVWPYLTAIPLVFAIISIVTTMEAFGHQISMVILSIRFSVIVGSVMVSFLLAKVIKQLENGVKAEEKSREAQRLLDLQGEQYSALTKSIEQTKAARHDLRHQLTAIAAMAEHQEYDLLKEFVERYRKSLPSDQMRIICDNYAANSVINHYIAMAIDEGIQAIDARCVIAQKTGVEDIDLCVILGNLLENAIEGCKTLTAENQRIKLRINTHKQNLLMTIDNTFDGVLLTENGEVLSRKRNNGEKGVGLSSVTAAVKKYGGELRYEEKDGWFMVSVILDISGGNVDE